MTNDWLVGRLSVEEAEAAHMHEGVPFGFSNRRWVGLKAKMLPGDELWEFRSPPASWANMCGRAGISLVRDGRVIDSLVTMMN